MPEKLTPCVPGLVVATLTIYIRCVYRVVELNAGFDSHLANEEVTYMILEGAMIAIAVCAMSILHPGLVFASHWAESNFKLGKKTSSLSHETETSDAEQNYSPAARSKWQ